MRLPTCLLLVAPIAAGCAARSNDLLAPDDGAAEGAVPTSISVPLPGESPATQRGQRSGTTTPPVATAGTESPDAPTPDIGIPDATTMRDASAPDATLDDAPDDDAAPDALPGPDGGPNANAVGSSSDAGPPSDVDAADAPGGGEIPLDCPTGMDHPTLLQCTGLYSDWSSRTIAPAARPYAPGLVLWSDGAEKSRWIELPPGSTIDTRDMDEWSFPMGTKIWKEFRLAGRPVETRFLWKRSTGEWLATTYAWSADGSSATEVTTGVTNVGGGTYEIPSQKMCTMCHQGRIDSVLGFDAVSLSAPSATGLPIAELVREGLLTDPPSAPIVVPGGATDSAALGWLHANCGTACHNRSPRALAGRTGLFMRLDVASMATVEATDTWTTAVGQPSNFQPAPGANLLLIDPGNPSDSAVYFRPSFRDDQGQGFQMPPIDTHVVSDAGVAAIGAWIEAMR